MSWLGLIIIMSLIGLCVAVLIFWSRIVRLTSL
jgi:hypothetical protein